MGQSAKAAVTVRHAAWGALALLAACSGQVEPGAAFVVPGAPESPWAVGGGPGSLTAGRSGGAQGAGQGPGPNAPGAEGVITRVGIHRLNNREYDNTIFDLLGVRAEAAAGFIADEKALGFDNIADALGMTEAQYEQYWDSADALAEAVFADRALGARILTCQPEASDELACMQAIARDFGRRAFRRPLDDEERDALVAVAQRARELGEPFEGSIEQLVKAALGAPQFLYRIELDPDPDSAEPHPLDGYELASRLSYLLWSSMPDETLFELAESGELLMTGTLLEQVDRLLRSDRSREFVAGFGGQWLGLRALESHQIDSTVFPDWNDGLRGAMVGEGLAYFTEFLDRGMDEFFTADVNFVDGPLARLYGLRGTHAMTTRIEERTDQRRGFLGLASFLTLTSFAHRTAPTLRGKWVLENLLCEQIAPPPANVPELDVEPEGEDEPQSVNVRERLAEHRENPQCAGCHTILDPIGLGLENFDAIGRYRSEYAPGDAIDASGLLPDGRSFSGIAELSGLLADDARLPECASTKLLTYALSRKLLPSDQPFLDAIREEWRSDGMTLRALVERIVLSDPFRMRAGEAP